MGIDIKDQALCLLEKGMTFEEMSSIYHLASIGWVEAGSPREQNLILNKFCDLVHTIGELTGELELIKKGSNDTP